MGDKNSTQVASATPKMVPVEQVNAQMQGMMNQYNAKMQQLTAQLQQLDGLLRDRTIDHLFNVLKYAAHFNSEFVVKCVEALEKYLTQVALTEPEQTEVKPEAEKQD